MSKFKKNAHLSVCIFQACAMFLCIVMDYYTNGDLRTFINEYQKKQEAIDEEVCNICFKEIAVLYYMLGLEQKFQ